MRLYGHKIGDVPIMFSPIEASALMAIKTLANLTSIYRGYHDSRGEFSAHPRRKFPRMNHVELNAGGAG